MGYPLYTIVYVLNSSRQRARVRILLPLLESIVKDQKIGGGERIRRRVRVKVSFLYVLDFAVCKVQLFGCLTYSKLFTLILPGKPCCSCQCCIAVLFWLFFKKIIHNSKSIGPFDLNLIVLGALAHFSQDRLF